MNIKYDKIIRQLFIIIISTLSITIVASCAGEADLKSTPKGFGSCLSQITNASLRRAAKEFISSDTNSRKRLLDEYQKAVKQYDFKNENRLNRLLGYFTDITDPMRTMLDGSHIPMAYTGSAKRLEIENIPGTVAPNWTTIEEPLWSDYPIPNHLMVTNYPVFRGERSLVGYVSESETLLEPYSPVWDRLEKLFTKGTSTKDRPLTDQWHRDVFEHTADSEGSPFLGSSVDFIIARRFGRKPSTKWSAIIEFRGSGVDVNATGEYFQKLGFLLAGKAAIPLEMEIAINRGIPPEYIRGVWFVDKDGPTYFVKNPNFAFNDS